MVRIRANASIRLPINGVSAEGSHREPCHRNRHNTSSEKGDDSSDCASAAVLLAGLAAFLAGVAVGVVECLAAGLSLAAGAGARCPKELAYKLMGAGITALVGCAPMAAARVRDTLCLRATLAKQRRCHSLRRRRIEAESAMPANEEPQQPQASTTADADKNPAASTSANNADAQSTSSLLLSSAMWLDLVSWAVLQMERPQLQLLHSDSGKPPSQIVRRFLTGIWRFYRPVPRPDHDFDCWERRRLVVALLFLPMSGTYAMQLANQIYVTNLGAACRTSGFLMAAGQCAVWLRAGLVGLGLLACLIGSCVELVHRCIRSNRLAVRLRQEKQSLFSRIFG